MSSGVSEEHILRPVGTISKKSIAVLVGALILIGAWLPFYIDQLANGLAVTELGDWGSSGGVTWGLYIGAFIWWVGIAHGGIILSAAVRLFGMDKYQPVARLAELLTIGALSIAGLFILIHTGRPDRLVTSVLPAWPTHVQWSPLVWDVTVITLYFVLTATYLSLTIRYDVARLRDQMPDVLSPVYDVITFKYSEDEDPVVERMVWWLAGAIIVLAPLLLHGGVIPWLFALLPSMPGFAGGVQGPTFLSIALTSAIAGVIIASAWFRYAYDWQELFPRDMFQGLAKWLGLFSLLFLWLQLQTIITGTYAAPTSLEKVTNAMIGEVAYWIAIGLVALGLVYILASAVRPALFSIPRIVAVSVFVLFGTLLEKVLFVVEGIMYPHFDLYHAVPGDYFPGIHELMAIVGSIGIIVLFFWMVSRVIPIVELHAVEEHHGDGHDVATDGGTPETDDDDTEVDA